ncbi:MAG: 2-polyprenylphenol hydroxylase [Corynebacterium camporealensis]|uniref:2-polyprenylphenol hydroxylase n=1 Tax=Corynebacterium camporealensis TaxID=161896 RepID=UPI002A91CE8B|nr:2-polyprenylphenol hydroxylase [Corynebacterium camporealensis]MDY5841113.1 2-polyprenylphenol hydroxylase [Corynebacterium camporealensis]
MKELADHLRRHANEYRDAVHQHFFNTVLESRQIFSLQMRHTHVELAPALAWAFDRAQRDGTLTPELEEQLTQLGRDHRRHGFPPEIYTDFAHSLIAGFDALGLTPYQRQVASHAVTEISHVMANAAREADLEGQAPAFSAQVQSVTRPNRQTSIITLKAGADFDYKPGQHMPVTSQLLPGTWRMLTPAHPYSADGELVFHLAQAGDASSMLAKAQPGDWWILGPATGQPPQVDSHTVIITFGTGWATARALLLEHLPTLADAPPRTYAVAPSPGWHYDTIFQANLQALYPKLEFHHLVREVRDPWLLGAVEPDPSFTPELAPEPIDAVLEHEKQHKDPNKRFLLLGPADRVELSRSALMNAGISEDAIDEVNWQRGHEWAASAAQLDGYEDWYAWAEAKRAEWNSTSRPSGY